MEGTLVVVATPIGNLGDLAPRARESLEEADLVACEDTRRTGLLLSKLGVSKPLVSLHEHNERRRLPKLMAALDAGERVALVSDAGTPLLSDPGYLVVREAAAAGHRVTAIPGPSALLAAIVVSGLPAIPLTFAGFPPRKGGRRRSFYARFAELGHTVVFYESPHRVAASLADALDAMGDRPAVVGRELTKLHEEVLRGRLSELRDELAGRERIKGEIVLVVGGGDQPEPGDA